MKILKKVLEMVNREVPIEILKKRGMKVGKNFSKQQGCFIDPSHCFLIEIGNNVTFSIRVTLLAHDASSKKILDYAKQKRIPIVIATTGFSDTQLLEIKNLSNTLPIFRSSNMSLDINLMAKLVQKIAEVLKDSDIEIIETHHNRKVDSPSGTAILLADAINQVFNNEKVYDFDRMQKREKRSKNEIGFSSVRGGNIVGEHTVKFFSENETLEITHTSYSRQVFAEGALKAARFIVTKEYGLYDMNDLLDK